MVTGCCHQRRYDMNGRFQMQGGKNWILPKEMNANRFFYDSHWLEILSIHFCPSMGPNEGSVAMNLETIEREWGRYKSSGPMISVCVKVGNLCNNARSCRCVSFLPHFLSYLKGFKYDFSCHFTFGFWGLDYIYFFRISGDRFGSWSGNCKTLSGYRFVSAA